MPVGVSVHVSTVHAFPSSQISGVQTGGGVQPGRLGSKRWMQPTSGSHSFVVHGSERYGVEGRAAHEQAPPRAPACAGRHRHTVVVARDIGVLAAGGQVARVNLWWAAMPFMSRSKVQAERSPTVKRAIPCTGHCHRSSRRCIHIGCSSWLRCTPGVCTRPSGARTACRDPAVAGQLQHRNDRTPASNTGSCALLLNAVAVHYIRLGEQQFSSLHSRPDSGPHGMSRISPVSPPTSLHPIPVACAAGKRGH
jgi:hypothetical protein